MSRIRALMNAEISTRPFEIANRVLVPLAIMGLGSYRVWLTARSPYEEFVGVMLMIALGLLWSIFFGYVAPQPSGRGGGRRDV